MSGCATPPRQSSIDPDKALAEVWSSPPPHSPHTVAEWLDEHQVAKSLGYAVVGGLALVGLLTTAAIIAAATSNHGFFAGGNWH
jgi:hypothetical protein